MFDNLSKWLEAYSTGNSKGNFSEATVIILYFISSMGSVCVFV